MTMQIDQIPRVAARTGFRAARLPLTAAETVFRRGDDWAPTRAYETVEARFKQMVGRVVRDDELVAEGVLEQAKTRQLGKATALESSAEREKEAADAAFEQRRKADEEEREQVEAQAAARKRAADQERAQKQQRIEAEAAQRARASQEAKARSEEAIAKQERSARKEKVAAEREAVHDERKAVEAERDVHEVDEQLEAAKAARRGT
jgi:colicin import membrane protein